MTFKVLCATTRCVATFEEEKKQKKKNNLYGAEGL